MIDLFADLLGPLRSRRPDDAVALARLAVASGTQTLVCCPPAETGLSQALDTRDAGVEALGNLLVEHGVGLDVLPGIILELDQVIKASDDELRRASLGANGRWVLVRLPERGWPLRLPDLIDGLDVRGFGLIIAEPERSDSLQRSPDRLREIVGRGALVLVSARSLKAEHGPRVRWAAANLLRGGMVHLLGSGGDSADRPPVMDDGLAEAAVTLRREAEELAWLVQDGPAAVLAGGPVRPPRISLHRGNPGAERPDFGVPKPPSRR